MKRNWERERNYWLDHFGQYHPGSRRNSDKSGITPDDYIGIPIPLNLSIPLNPPCLIWRWKLRGGGYGALNGRGAHVIAFEQTRGRPVREERQINHLCNRPFCIQPAHLYEGTAKQNSEDRQAEVADGKYPRWQTMAHRFDRALTQHHWEAPVPAAVSTSWHEPLECPHTELPGMFEKGGKTGEEKYCANCREVRSLRDGREQRAPSPCGMSQPCRCEAGEKSREEERLEYPLEYPSYNPPSLKEDNERRAEPASEERGMTREESPAEEHPAEAHPKMEEEMEAVSDLDPASPRMALGHSHQTYRTVELRKFTASRQECLCGAHRETGLMLSGTWVGGEPVDTPWKRAHLEAVRQAVEKSAPLLELQPAAIQDLHRILLNDPPSGTEGQDLPALAAAYQVAVGAARRLLEWRQNEEEAEAEKKAGRG